MNSGRGQILRGSFNRSVNDRALDDESDLVLDFRFAEDARLYEKIDFTRNSGATQTNSSGLVAFAPENLVKNTDNFSEGTNLWTYRSGNSISFTANQTDPNGGTDAALFANVTGSGANDFWKQVTGIGANAPYIPSFFIKRVTTSGELKVLNPFGGTSQWRIDMSKLPDDWVRITPSHSAVTVNTPFTAHTNGSGGIWFRSSDGSPLSFYLAFPQVERTFDNTSEPSDFIENKTGNALFKERFDYTKDGDKKGLLIEEQRTNLFTYSQDLSQWNWISNDGHILANAAISPSGVKDAAKIIPNATDGQKLLYPPSNPTATTGNTYCMSVYVKKAGHRYFKFYFNDSASRLLHVDLDTGQATASSISGGYGVEEVGNDWYRVWFSHTLTANLGSIYWNSSNDSSYPVSFTGDGSSGVFVWGAQFEQGSFATSLIPTYGATASRSADIATISGTNFNRFFRDTEGTIVADVQLPRGWSSPNYNRLYAFTNDAVGSNRIESWIAGNNFKVYADVVAPSSEAKKASDTLLTSGEIARIAQVYKTNFNKAYQDGEQGDTDTTVTLPTGVNRLNIAGLHSALGATLGGWIRRFRYFNKKKSDSAVEKLTDTSFLLDKFKGAKAAHSLRSLRDGRDSSPVCSVRREYDNFESSYSAAQVSNGDLEKDFRSADQTTLPLDVSCEAVEMVTGGDFTNLITNGDYATDSDWTKGTGWSIGSGVASCDGSQTAGTGLDQTITLKAGVPYTIIYTITRTAGSMDARLQGSGSAVVGTSRSSSGTFSEILTPVSGDDTLRFRGNVDFVGTVDNVSVVEGSWTATGGTTADFTNSTLRVQKDAGLSGVHGVQQQITAKPFTQYKVTLDIVATTADTGRVLIGHASDRDLYHNSNLLAVGSYSFDVTTGDFNNIQIRLANTSTSNAGDITYDNVTLKEVNSIGSAFSTRLVNSDYTGYAMRVRNFDDNIEAEVSFDSNNEISLDSPVKATSMNLLGFSEDFGSWSTYNAGTITSGQADPFGGNNASKIISPDASAYNGIVLNTAKSASDTNYTFSYYQKKDSTQTNLSGFEVSYNGVSSKLGYYIVNPSTGTCILSSSSTAGVAASINVESVNDDWWRISATQVDTGANTNVRITFYPGFSSNGTTIANLAGEMTIHAAQLEETVYEDTGTEKWTNGDFSDGTTGYDIINTGGTVEVTNGALRIATSSAASNFVGVSQDINYVAGKKYKITFDYVHGEGNAGSTGLTVVHPVASPNFTTTGSKSIEFVATTTAAHSTFFKRTVGGAVNDFTIDNISVLEYDPELQTYTQTPVISDAHNSTSATNLREFAGKENLLSYSEDFSQWTAENATVTSGQSDPNGGQDAYKLVPTSSSQRQAIKLSVSKTGDLSASVFAKKGEYDVLQITDARNGSFFVNFDLTNGTVGSSSGVVGKIESVGDDWFRCSSTFTDSTGDILSVRLSIATASNSARLVDFAGNGSDGLFIFAAQLNTNSLKDYQKTSGSAKTADVHCVVWYDQGMGEDATQSTASSQPRLVKGSELVTDSGGKAALDFDADHDNLYIDQLAGHQRLDAYYVVDPNVTKYSLASSYNAPTAYFLIVENGSSVASKNNSGEPNYFVNGSSQSGTRDDFHDVLEGDNKVVGVTNIDTSAWVNFQVGEYWTSSAASFSFGGTISEMLFFPNMDTSPKRFNIEQNMIQHFKDGAIYSEDFSDDTGGWIAAEGGAGTINITHETTSPISGSGSLRLTMPSTGSSTGYPRVRVFMGTDVRTNVKYRLSFKAQLLSGEAECDIRFGTATLNMKFARQAFSTTLQTYTFTETFDTLPSGSLDGLDFLFNGTKAPFDLLIDDVKVEEVGVEGYLTTLYDQTQNNNHALQATAAYQPKLVNGGDLIKSGNHPAWEHVTASNMLMEGKIQAAHLDAWFVAETSDVKYLYPGNYASSGDHGFVAQDGSSSTGLVADYGGGNEELYVNGTLITGAGTTRDEVHTALNGRKLVHHQDADTADWAKLQMGYYGSSSTDSFNFEGKFSEWIWYDSDQSSNRTGIESNINTHYNIY